MDNTNSKEYWNGYVEYWEDKVRQANSGGNASDKTSDDVILEAFYKKLNVKEDDALLDYGCGSGRLYPIYDRGSGGAGNYFGIDISSVCLEHAQKRHEGLKIGENLQEFDGLHIPFNDGAFDRIICFGVFDACSQEKAIAELFRVLKTGGAMLVTGKNNKYFEDDEMAAIAEVNAKKKGHPNYFTDVHNLTIQLLEHKAKLIETCYFLRRGDFTRNQAVNEMPEVFYEWAYVIEKTEEYTGGMYRNFSDRYSINNRLGESI